MKVEILSMQPAHIASVAQILHDAENNRFHPNPPSIKESMHIAKEWLASEGVNPRYRVAVSEGEVIGIGGVVKKCSASIGSYYNIFFRVDHAKTKSGVGSQLALQGIHEASDQTLPLLGITRSNNTPAIGLLKKLGFVSSNLLCKELEDTQTVFEYVRSDI